METPVTIPNEDLVSVSGKGSCTLPNMIDIDKVLYIPSFNYNLLSVSRVTKDLGCAITFSLIFATCRTYTQGTCLVRVSESKVFAEWAWQRHEGKL